MSRIPWKALLFLPALLGISHQVSTPDSPTYVAGVVEFEPSSNADKLANLRENLDGYLKIINSADAANTDIIVFPEATLNYHTHLPVFVPEPSAKWAPCANLEDDLLKELSCAAKNNKKYLVINLLEKENCTDDPPSEKNPRHCSKNKLNVYNTNVVFDRNGTIVSRYRKWNLFHEPLNVTKEPDHAVFVSDFGVKFGHFICFDILFHTPSIELVRDYHVTDVLYPTMWFSELPYLSAIQVQSAWAYANDVNLLAAGASFPAVGSTGTGIYAGREGVVIAAMEEKPERKIYVSTVIKKNTPNRKEKYCRSLSSDKKVEGVKVEAFNTKDFVTKLLVPSKNTDEDQFVKNQKLCKDNFCCSFDVTFHHKSAESLKDKYYYHYRLAVNAGNRTYNGTSEGFYKTCGIIACTDANLSSCGHTFKKYSEDFIESVTFKEVIITSEVISTTKSILMPNSVTTSLMPVDVDSFEMDVFTESTDTNSFRKVRYALRGSRSDILAFGFYVNEFDTSNAESFQSHISIALMTILFFLCYHFQRK